MIGFSPTLSLSLSVSGTYNWTVSQAAYDFTHARYATEIGNAFVEGKSLPHDTASPFNAVSRRSPFALFSGDLPWFALGTSPLSADMNPPWFKLGDLRFAVSAMGHERTWLDGVSHCTLLPLPSNDEYRDARAHRPWCWLLV